MWLNNNLFLKNFKNKKINSIIFKSDNIIHNIWDVTQEEICKNTIIIIENNNN